MTEPPIRAVAFDFSGVMTMNPLGGLATLEAELGCAPGTLGSEFRGGELFCRCELGQLSTAEFFTLWRAKLRAVHGLDVDLEPILAIFRRGGVINGETMSLIGRLAPDYRLAIVTNNVREVRESWRRKIPIDRFEVVLDSSEVGLRKPDPAIYELLLERLQLRGPEVAYVDDYADNLVPAAALGMRTVLFTTAAECEAALAALGVRITSPPWGEVARSAGEGEPVPAASSPPHSRLRRGLSPKGRDEEGDDHG